MGYRINGYGDTMVENAGGVMRLKSSKRRDKKKAMRILGIKTGKAMHTFAKRVRAEERKRIGVVYPAVESI